MKILVTGSSGTIGTALCEKLTEEGFDVVCVDSKPNKWNRELDKKTILVDLTRKEEVMQKLPKDAGLVIHLAAFPLVHKSVLNPDLAFENYRMFYNTIEFARQAGVKKFMFASSREVYGNSGQVVHKECDINIERMESPYSASKFGSEALIHAYKKCYGIDFIIFRFSNVYGKYDDSDRVMPMFIRLSKKNGDVTVFGREKTLDFTYIDDAVNGIVLGVRNFDKAKNNTINLAYGNGTTILRVAELIQKETGSRGRIIVSEPKTGEVIKYIADISNAGELLGYEPKVAIEEGVRKSVEWYTKNGLA
jgi:UDP-glucose 4-epimerase